ncbi:MAG: sigma-70 family RNA polymerase sigma factor, partial [Chloroflexota bacterium]|nr:sigma-70 family RNA polymerase sigma factor [Chloroflexota bacterium]
SRNYAGTFDELFAANLPHVLAYAARRSLNLPDAEDATSETFTIAWRRFGAAPAVPLPWLYAIARRVLANQHRAHGRLKALLVSLSADLLRRSPVAPGNDAALDALGRLSDSDQELVRLVAWEGLDHGAIAATLGTSANAVAIRLHRARKRFAEEYAKVNAAALKDSGRTRTFALSVEEINELDVPRTGDAR